MRIVTMWRLGSAREQVRHEFGFHAALPRLVAAAGVTGFPGHAGGPGGTAGFPAARSAAAIPGAGFCAAVPAAAGLPAAVPGPGEPAGSAAGITGTGHERVPGIPGATAALVPGHPGAAGHSPAVSGAAGPAP